MKNFTDKQSMKTLTAVHKILKIYDDCLDNEELDIERLNPKALKISENRFTKIIELLSEENYISNVKIKNFNDGTKLVDFSESSITLAGLKYYAENTLFLKAAGVLPDLLTAGISIV